MFRPQRLFRSGSPRGRRGVIPSKLEPGVLPYHCRVIPLDETERDRWRAHADDELRAAKHNAGGGFHHVAVLHAELAAQCALKALLRGVGRTEHARGHDLPSGHYGPVDAERAVGTAEQVLAAGDAARTALLAAAKDADDADRT